MLATVKSKVGVSKSVFLPFDKAKKSAPAGKVGLITYTVRAYFTRLNTPAFPVAKSYQIRACVVTNCLQSDKIETIMSGIQIPTNLFAPSVVTVDLTWIYGKKENMMTGPHELYVENDVTTTKFSPQSTIRDTSEDWIDIQPFVTGDPSPTQ